MRRWLRRFMRVAVVLLFAVPVYLFVMGFLILQQARRDEASPAQAIVVLGAGVYGRRPSPVYRARLDQALSLWRRGYAPRLALTGGFGETAVISEAEAGRDYLQAQGVPTEAMLLETESHTTYENLSNLIPLFAAQQITIVIIVSDGFHLLRARSMAVSLGLVAYTSPAADSPIRPGSRAEVVAVIDESWQLGAFWLASLFGARGVFT